ncbi:unnamed protein product, partial [Mesorhabditis spiculigera]
MMWKLLLAVALFSVVLAELGLPEEQLDDADRPQLRAKRQYGYDSYGWGGDYWYAGRIFGIIIGILLLICCCCVPLICILGVWFLGWFGIKRRQEAKRKGFTTQQAPPTTVPQPQNVIQLHSEPQPIIRNIHTHRTRSHSPPRTYTATQVPAEHIVYSAEDRYYTSSTSPRHNSRI